MKESKSTEYWEKRKDAIYLFVAREICKKYGGRPQTVLDVGSNGTPTLEWHRDYAKRLVSLDLRNPYQALGVESIQTNFFDYDPEEKFDLVTCFQVLEHIQNAIQFAQKLLSVSKILIVSVPYKWSEFACKYHIHDPVDNEKMLTWFNVKPAFSYVAKELSRHERLIHVYKNIIEINNPSSNPVEGN